jgi:hypothetical protein
VPFDPDCFPFERLADVLAVLCLRTSAWRSRSAAGSREEGLPELPEFWEKRRSISTSRSSRSVTLTTSRSFSAVSRSLWASSSS